MLEHILNQKGWKMGTNERRSRARFIKGWTLSDVIGDVIENPGCFIKKQWTRIRGSIDVISARSLASDLAGTITIVSVDELKDNINIWKGPSSFLQRETDKTISKTMF